MKVLVTGGAGFIGSDFVRLAARKGWKVTVVDKLTYAGDLERLKPIQDRLYFYNVDILDKDELRKYLKKSYQRLFYILQLKQILIGL
jgi:dTDP-glucose 4,6-dehydratase (EC 4.2.1.46)